MGMRRTGREEREQGDEQTDGLRVYSGDEDDEFEDEEEEGGDLFELGQPCDVCQKEDGRIGLDPTCRGSYEGNPVLLCFNCAPAELASAWGRVEGVSAIVEPFGEYSAHYYYRIDEMPAYQFVREDVEGISWLQLSVGDACARCGEQSHHAWLPRDMVDARLPENESVFRNLDRDLEHLCNNCAAAALAETYRSLDLPLITVELPRGAMGVLMPTAE